MKSDLTAYMSHLDGIDLPDEAKLKVLEALWTIGSKVVDASFDDVKSRNNSVSGSNDVVDYRNNNLTEEFSASTAKRSKGAKS